MTILKRMVTCSPVAPFDISSDVRDAFSVPSLPPRSSIFTSGYIYWREPANKGKAYSASGGGVEIPEGIAGTYP
jgi:hypothetical protein